MFGLTFGDLVLFVDCITDISTIVVGELKTLNIELAVSNTSLFLKFDI